jgi:hypothetical protein
MTANVCRPVAMNSQQWGRHQRPGAEGVSCGLESNLSDNCIPSNGGVTKVSMNFIASPENTAANCLV